MKDYANRIVNVNDFPRKGVIFRDITPLFEDSVALSDMMIDFCDAARGLVHFNKVICADARGFLYGPTVALSFGAGLVMSRKPGKLPRPGKSYKYELEYGSGTMEISAGSINPGDTVVVVDDLLATGGSAEAMGKMVRQSGGTVVGFLFMCELCELSGRKHLEGIFRGVPVKSLIKYNCAVGDTVEVDTSSIVDEDQLRFNAVSSMEVLSVENNSLVCAWERDFKKDQIIIPKSYVRSVICNNGSKREFFY